MSAAFDFETAVVERSRTRPVLVDFQADWCGPCRVLGPILADLAARAAGRWELVAVDVDAHPDLAARFEVRGIPAMKLFRDGTAVAELVGLRSAEEIERWLADHLPEPHAGELQAIADEPDPAVRRERLETLVARYPDLPRARLTLAQELALTAPDRARTLVADLNGDLMDEADDVTALAELAELPEPPPERLAGPLEDSRRALRAGDHDRALERLVEAVEIDRPWGNELARRAAVALFHRLGSDHELTRRHRRRLAMVLHS